MSVQNDNSSKTGALVDRLPGDFRRRLAARLRGAGEFVAVAIVAPPDPLALLQFRMARHEREPEATADVDLDIRHDLRAAWRDVDDRAFMPGRTVVEADPRRAALHLP